MVIQKLLLEEGVKRGLKASREYSVSVLGYDFIGLISRLAIFFITGFLIRISTESASSEITASPRKNFKPADKAA